MLNVKWHMLLERIPLVDEAVEHAAQFIKLRLVMHHLLAGDAGDRVILAEEDGLLGTDFLAHAAVDAADHVDLELLRPLLDLRPLRVRGDFLGSNGDGAWWADEFTQ